jgi:hypothetical protein
VTSTPTILVLVAVLVVDSFAAKKHKRRKDFDLSLQHLAFSLHFWLPNFSL